MNFLILLIFLASCGTGSENGTNKGRLDFDTTFHQNKWLVSNRYERGRMVKNLIESDRLKALTEDSIFRLLGTPLEQGNGFCNYLVNSKDTIITNNFMLLHIEFDTLRHRVADYWLTD